MVQDASLPEKDLLLQKKIRKFAQITEQDLDLPAGMILDTTLKMINELVVKMEKKYKAPREKLICIVNCSKLVSGEYSIIQSNFRNDQ